MAAGPSEKSWVPPNLQTFPRGGSFVCYNIRKIKNSTMKILPTKFARYSVSDTGIVFRDGRELKSHPRGVITENGTRYQAVNISIYDDNGKFAKQIKYYVHRLVAEAFIENPNNLSDVDHIDRNKENNYVDNLRWCSRIDNMAWNAKRFKITDTRTGKVYVGNNNISWIKENWEWISKRTKMDIVSYTKYLNYRKKACGLVIEKYDL